MKLKKQAKLSGTVSPLTVSAKVGSIVTLDNSPHTYRTLTENEWEGADFLWPVFNTGPIKEVAVNVYVTGRTIQWRDVPSVRVQVEFVGDGEPSTFAKGWLNFNTADQKENLCQI